MSDPVLEVHDLRKTYGSGGRMVKALDGVDLSVGKAEIVGLVGESGSGKSTLARCAAGIIRPSGGSVRCLGLDVLRLSGSLRRKARRRVQMVYQDPQGSLDPRIRVESAITEVLSTDAFPTRTMRSQRAQELLVQVGLNARQATRFPHELSGGQRQRVAIARALATEPEVLIADEPVSALDVSVRAQVLNLLTELRRRDGIAILLIAHDLDLVARVADRVVVLFAGRVMEEGPASAVLTAPQHPYTQTLLEAIPGRPRSASAPSASRPIMKMKARLSAKMPAGPNRFERSCVYYDRCPRSGPRCAQEQPLLETFASQHRFACFFPESGHN